MPELESFAPVMLPRTFAASRRRADHAAIDSWSAWLGSRAALGGIRLRTSAALARATAAAAVAKDLRTASAAQIADRSQRVAKTLRREGLERGPVVEALGVASEISRRVLAMSPFEQQVAAAASLVRGEAVGDGRPKRGQDTLSGFLAAAVFALAGRAVHVVTTNDYLARRDAEFLGPALAELGLGWGLKWSTVCRPTRAARLMAAT